MKQTSFIILFVSIIAFGLAGFGPLPKIEEGVYPSPSPFAPDQINLSVAAGSSQDLQITAFNFLTTTALPQTTTPTARPNPTAQAASPAPTCSTATGRNKIDLLIDTSGSMGTRDNGGNASSSSEKTKIEQLKEALIAVGDKFSDTNVVGIQSFNSFSTQVLPIKPFSQHKSAYNAAIQAIVPNYSTFTKDGVIFAQKAIDDYNKANGNVTDYNDWLFVLMSDGAAGVGQDPTATVKNMRNRGMKVITIAFGSDKGAPTLKPLATNPDTDYFLALSGSDLTKAYIQIIQNIACP